MKTILITGATDGIGLETAKTLAAAGHRVLLHGRSAEKLSAAAETVGMLGGEVETFRADLSDLATVVVLANKILARHSMLDVIINNAGVLKAPETTTVDGLDVRFAVNTYAPYLLSLRLLPALAPLGRIVNLSSAAQAPVSLSALASPVQMADMDAYAQSKLALTIWSRELAEDLSEGQVSVAVNPGSLLGSKMVKEGFGVAGGDLQVGADVLSDAATGERFASANGLYFDNDSGAFAEPHAWAADPTVCAGVVQTMRRKLETLGLLEV
ncbi:MAG: SDR family NAD(P)-dependent oxidoreductase [Pseudomonadota bacterium]